MHSQSLCLFIILSQCIVVSDALQETVLRHLGFVTILHCFYYIATFHHIASCDSAVQSDNRSCKRTFSLRKWTSCNVCFNHLSIVTLTLVTIICWFQPSSQIGSSHLRLTVKSCLIIHTLFSVSGPCSKSLLLCFYIWSEEAATVWCPRHFWSLVRAGGW